MLRAMLAAVCSIMRWRWDADEIILESFVRSTFFYRALIDEAEHIRTPSGRLEVD